MGSTSLPNSSGNTIDDPNMTTTSNDNTYNNSSSSISDIDSLVYNTAVMSIADNSNNRNNASPYNYYTNTTPRTNRHRHQLSINSLSSVSSTNSMNNNSNGNANVNVNVNNGLYNEPSTPPLYYSNSGHMMSMDSTLTSTIKNNNKTSPNNNINHITGSKGSVTPVSSIGQYYCSPTSPSMISTTNSATSSSSVFTNQGYTLHQKSSSLDMGRSFYQSLNSMNNGIPSSTYNNNVVGVNGNNNINNNIAKQMYTHNRLRSLPFINEFDISPLPNPSQVTHEIQETQEHGQKKASQSNYGSVKVNVETHNKKDGNTDVTNNTNVNASSNVVVSDLSNLPLEDIEYLKLTTDQYGCRFLQKKLETEDISDKVRDLIFENIQAHFLQLIIDPFGNYLIQKLCDYLNFDQKTVLLKNIYKNLYEISINQYGTRSLQKIIDSISTSSTTFNQNSSSGGNLKERGQELESNDKLINILMMGFNPLYGNITNNEIISLTNDLNGNHVIQKCIFKFEPIHYDFIIDSILDKNNIVKVSTHKHGCCVLQKLLSSCTIQQIFKISIKVLEYSPNLINDQFGNYILQFLFEIDDLNFYLLNEIFEKLKKNLIQMSCLKFSSNVVEKYLKKLFKIVTYNKKYQTQYNQNNKNNNNKPNAINGVFDHDDVAIIAQKIILNILDLFTTNLNTLIRDNYGNYALQTLLDVKNYSSILVYSNNCHNNDDMLNNQTVLEDFKTDLGNGDFQTIFSSKIEKLIILTKNLLPSIKTTSYAKKVKLKVKAYIELTGLVLDSNSNATLAPVTGSGIISDVSNNTAYQYPSTTPANHYYYSRNGSPERTLNNNLMAAPSVTQAFNKVHTRHVSLPANTFSLLNQSQMDYSMTSLKPIDDKNNNKYYSQGTNFDLSQQIQGSSNVTPYVHSHSSSSSIYNQPVSHSSPQQYDTINSNSMVFNSNTSLDYNSSIWNNNSFQQPPMNYNNPYAQQYSSSHSTLSGVQSSQQNIANPNTTRNSFASVSTSSSSTSSFSAAASFAPSSDPNLSSHTRNNSMMNGLSL